MTWLKIDDGFVDHPKVIGLKDRAFRVHVSALCYAARFPSERGRIPQGALRQIGASTAVVHELISSGLWDEMEDGLYLHDFTEYNPPPPEGLKAKRAEAGRIGGIKSAATRASKREATGKQVALQANEAPSRPVPFPLDDHFSNEKSSSSDDDDGGPSVREMADAILSRLPYRHQHDPVQREEAEAFARQFPGQHHEMAIAMQRCREQNQLPYPGNLRKHMPGFAPERSSSNGRPTGPLGGLPPADTPPEHIDPRTGKLRPAELIAANDALHARLRARDEREAAQRAAGDAAASA